MCIVCMSAYHDHDRDCVLDNAVVLFIRIMIMNVTLLMSVTATVPILHT